MVRRVIAIHEAPRRRRGRPTRHPMPADSVDARGPASPAPVPLSTPNPGEAAADSGSWDVTSAQLARRFGVTPRTIQRLAEAGELPHVCLGAGSRKVLRFRLSDVLAVVERRGKDPA